MKTMNCKQLGGSCDKEFHANTFEEMAELSKQHGTEMFQKQDSAHLEAMKEMLSRVNYFVRFDDNYDGRLSVKKKHYVFF